MVQDGVVDYDDGTPATRSQIAKDVVEFLTWVGNQEWDTRKVSGMKSIGVAGMLLLLMVHMNRTRWATLKSRKIFFVPKNKWMKQNRQLNKNDTDFLDGKTQKIETLRERRWKIENKTVYFFFHRYEASYSYEIFVYKMFGRDARCQEQISWCSWHSTRSRNLDGEVVRAVTGRFSVRKMDKHKKNNVPTIPARAQNSCIIFIDKKVTKQLRIKFFISFDCTWLKNWWEFYQTFPKRCKLWFSEKLLSGSRGRAKENNKIIKTGWEFEKYLKRKMIELASELRGWADTGKSLNSVYSLVRSFRHWITRETEKNQREEATKREEARERGRKILACKF